MLFRKQRLDWRYGISELVIVVMGVLIALAADGWSQRQADRVPELHLGTPCSAPRMATRY